MTPLRADAGAPSPRDASLISLPLASPTRLLSADGAAAAGGRLALFHADAVRHPEGVDYAARVERNLGTLLPLIAVGDREGLERFAHAYLVSADEVLRARAASGMVLDGHGDLRLDHLPVEAEGVVIVHRMVAGPDRIVDVADDLAVLLVELADLTGTRAAGDAVMFGYVQAGGQPQPDALLAFFGTYRAQAEAQAELVRSAEPSTDGPAAEAHAARLLALSRRLTWRARGRLVLLVAGSTEGAASALAESLGAVSGLPVLSADAHILGRASGIMDLADRVRSEGTAIVDAGGGDAQRQGALAALLADGGSRTPLLVECRVPPANGDAYEHLDAIAGVGAGDRLAVGVSASLATQVDEVEAWLDSLLAAGREG